jgi:cell division protein ZapA
MSQIEARILQQDYVLTCPEGQEDMLLAAVQRVDADMEHPQHRQGARPRTRGGAGRRESGVRECIAVHPRAGTRAGAGADAGKRPGTCRPCGRRTARSPAEDTPRDDTLQQALQAQEEAQALAAQLQELLALREHELQQAQALIERLEAALEVDSKLL